MTLHHVLIIMFSVFFLVVGLFVLWEIKGVRKSSPVKIQVIDDLFTLFYFFMVLAIIVFLIISLREKESGRDNFFYLFPTLLSSLSISGCIIGVSSNFYRKTRQLRGLVTPDPGKLVGYHGLSNSYQAMAFFGLAGVHLFIYFIFGHIVNIPTFMTMSSLPLDITIFFICAVPCLVIDFLTRFNFERYKYLGAFNIILIFTSFWFFGKNINSLYSYSPALYFSVLGVILAVILIVGLVNGLSYYRDVKLTDKPSILTLVRCINLSNIWVEATLGVGYITALIINLSLGLIK